MEYLHSTYTPLLLQRFNLLTIRIPITLYIPPLIVTFFIIIIFIILLILLILVVHLSVPPVAEMLPIWIISRINWLVIINNLCLWRLILSN
ncbi:hypothetical protein QBC32DRAFT_144853 [Pseudoneurospora amorphoporcata]|uniref:Uncharacterized protein n=1 Tax=Pseudoneurospora amorphoporcata TaxID=241081 RepID=A0AAN6NUK1_9PEZI|nr:hypothetical protein QBC32DRAFT_144853 [Pseudoneurospora amorphoporcata]